MGCSWSRWLSLTAILSNCKLHAVGVFWSGLRPTPQTRELLSTRVMRIKGICLTVAGLALAAWLVSNQWRLSKALDRGQSERAKIAEELASLRQQMEQDPAREKLDVAQNN